MNADQKRTLSENQLGTRKILDKSICSMRHKNKTPRPMKISPNIFSDVKILDFQVFKYRS